MSRTLSENVERRLDGGTHNPARALELATIAARDGKFADAERLIGVAYRLYELMIAAQIRD